MYENLRPRFMGAYIGLALIALAAVFFFVLLPGMSRAVNAAGAPAVYVRNYSNARLLRELGDYTQKIDCASIGAPGLTGYVWVDQAHKRLVIVCR